MKYLALFILLLSVSIYAADGDIRQIMTDLATQDGRFRSIASDLENSKNGYEGLTYREFMEDVAENFAQVAVDSPADPVLLQKAFSFFEMFAVPDTPVSRAPIAHMPVLRDHKPKKFFEKLSDKWEDLKEQAYEEIMNYDISAGIDLFSADIVEGINVSAQYKYKVDSDYSKGIHTRVDQWSPKTRINAMTLLKALTGIASPVYLNINAGKEIMFVRHFKEKWAAMKALPRTPIDMPLSAERAKKMEVGDFTSIPTTMGFNAGLSQGWTQGIISASASAGVLMTGEFRINIYKIDENHVRLKISGTRSHGYTSGGSLNYAFNLIAYKPEVPLAGEIDLNKEVGKILDTNFFRVNQSRIKSQKLTVDYVFDLRDYEACMAYEAIIFKTFKFKATEIGKEFIVENNLDDIVFGDLEPAEMLFQADKKLEPSQRRVDRVFMGSNYALSKNRSVKLGINLLKYTSSTSDIMNRVRVIDQNDVTSNYLYPIYVRNSGFDLLFGLWHEKYTRTAFSFQKSDAEWKPQYLYDIVLTVNHYDKRCREGELKEHLKILRNMFGPEISAKLRIDKYNDFKFTPNFTSRMKIALKSEGFRAIYSANLTENALYAAWIPIIKDCDYYSHHGDMSDDPDSEMVYISSKWSPGKKAAAKLCNDKWGGKYYWYYIQKIVKNFEKMNGKDLYQSVELMKDIYAKKGFYAEILPRYLVELTKLTSNLDNIYATVDFGGKEIQKHNAIYGHSDYDEIYQNIQEILYQVRYNSDIIPR